MKGFQHIYTGEDHRHGDSLQKHTQWRHKLMFLLISLLEPIDSNQIICVAINSLVANKAFQLQLY